MLGNHSRFPLDRGAVWSQTPQMLSLSKPQNCKKCPGESEIFPIPPEKDEKDSARFEVASPLANPLMNFPIKAPPPDEPSAHPGHALSSIEHRWRCSSPLVQPPQYSWDGGQPALPAVPEKGPLPSGRHARSPQEFWPRCQQPKQGLSAATTVYSLSFILESRPPSTSS